MTANDREAALIARTPGPRTRDSLARELSVLGVRPGMALIVHSSLGRIGWIVGGARSVVEALMDVLTPDGTLLMPTFSEQLSDPAKWRDPPVPEAWIETVRAHMPAFDPARTPTRNMGAIAEAFRTWPEVKRSTHPTVSLAAWGRRAERLVAAHSLDWPLGGGSPLGRFYELDGHVLLLGVGYNRNSSLHLAETRAKHRRTVRRRIPVARAGGVDWVDIIDVVDDESRLFPAIGADFEATGQVRLGPVGSAESRLMPHRALVDFAADWIDGALAPNGG